MTIIKPATFSQVTPSTALQDAKAMLETARSSQTASSESFGDRMGTAINSVAEAQNNTIKLTQDYEMGLENDLSKVMISQQISSLGFQLTLNARNKMLSAYKDIMNMPV
jgi:flagellar hook-basal body complex protein FliE